MPKVRRTLTKKTSRKGSGNNKASKLRPEDVPVPDSDLEEEPAKRKAVKAVKDNGLSRGQRKRLQRRENFLRKFELAKVVQAQDEAKSGLDLSGLTDGLEEALETSSHVQHSLKRPGRKVQAAKDQREMKHFQNVLNFDAFKNDPFGALEQHLKNSIKLQKEEEVKQKVKQKQTKTPASAVKDKLKEQKRTGTKNAKSVKSVKGKFSKPKRHK